MTKADAITELRRLADWKPRDKGDLSAWETASIALGRELARAVPDLPHVVWHYLHDADIRLKDPLYGAVQERRFLEELEAIEREARGG